MKHAPIPRDEPVTKSAKVINLMDALRKSIRGDVAPAGKKKFATPSATGSKKGITLVKVRRLRRRVSRGSRRRPLWPRRLLRRAAKSKAELTAAGRGR